jgi:hypothetical protein
VVGQELLQGHRRKLFESSKLLLNRGKTAQLELADGPNTNPRKEKQNCGTRTPKQHGFVGVFFQENPKHRFPVGWNEIFMLAVTRIRLAVFTV